MALCHTVPPPYILAQKPYNGESTVTSALCMVRHRYWHPQCHHVLISVATPNLSKEWDFGKRVAIAFKAFWWNLPKPKNMVKRYFLWRNIDHKKVVTWQKNRQFTKSWFQCSMRSRQKTKNKVICQNWSRAGGFLFSNPVAWVSEMNQTNYSNSRKSFNGIESYGF